MGMSGVLLGLGGELFRVARGPEEKLGVLRYGLQNAVARLAPGRRGETAITLDGLTVHVRIRNGELAAYREIYVDRVYERLPGFAPAPGATVLDAGANVGLFALRHARGGARVLAFEPNPDTFRRLRRNIRANGLVERIAAFPCALGAERGAARLLPAPSSPMSRVAADECGAIEMRTLDDVISDERLERVDLLKVDVEGAEADILRGGDRALARVRRIVLEHHSPRLLNDVRSLLTGRGFVELYADAVCAYFLCGAETDPRARTVAKGVRCVSE
jgi:FkbM family methyltransferase